MVKAKTKKQDDKKCKLTCFCNSNVFKRIATAVVLIPFVLYILYLGFPFINLFILVLGALFAYEWANMVKNKNSAFYATVYTAMLAVGALFPLPFVVVLSFLISSFLVYVKARDEEHKWLLVLGVLYVGIAMSSILWLAQGIGFFSMVWLLLMIWATDIGAYMVGIRLRGPKLAPKISPNKTWSGFFGGMLFALCVSASYVWGAGLSDFYLPYMIMALVVSVLGQVGDLLESAVKRKIGIKDSSQIIPGHGGVFDRLDSLLFVAPVLFLLLVLGTLFMM